MTQLRPAARELSPTLIALGESAPGLERFFDGLGPVIKSSKKGIPSIVRLLDDDLPPLLGAVNPFLRDFISILEVVRQYRHEITAFLGNATAATQAQLNLLTGGSERYLRAEPQLNPETAAAYPNRLRSNRANPYLHPLGYEALSSHLPVFDPRPCTAGIDATLDPADAADPDLPANIVETQPPFFERYRQYAFAGELSASQTPAPPCEQQGPFTSIGEPPREETDYLHVRQQP